jgi:Ca2+-binding RTX toxin-like protein
LKSATSSSGGGFGNDVPYGGKGKDVFVFNTLLNRKTNKDKKIAYNDFFVI